MSDGTSADGVDDRSATRAAASPAAMADRQRARALAAGLGVVSSALGALDAGAPRTALRLLGVRAVPGGTGTVRLVGLRELACGAGLLSGRAPRGWLVARVVGDVVDLALLARTASTAGVDDKVRYRGALGLLAGVTVVDGVAAWAVGTGRGRRTARADRRSEHVTGSVTVLGTPDEVYRAWRDLEQLPRLMAHVRSVETVGARSAWTATGPLGVPIRWEAEIVDDRPGELVAWRPRGDGGARTNGSVRFRRAPGDRGTEVHVEMNVDVPGGRLGRRLAHGTGLPRRFVHDELRRFKQVMETGHVVRSEGSPDGVSIGRLVAQMPAQPAEPTAEAVSS
jgi:uncharacterized membrane protein